MNKKILLITGIIILIIISLIIFRDPSTGDAIKDSVIIEEGSIKIPVEDISKNAQFYEYEGKEYFVVKAEDGSIKTAMNACDVCYRKKKGYRQEGRDMVCNNCGKYYAISDLGTKNNISGGCWPGYLPNKIEGSYVVIKKSDINAKRYMFS
jgi:uncharacterized membrane protein